MKSKKVSKVIESSTKNNMQIWRTTYKQLDNYKFVESKKLDITCLEEPNTISPVAIAEMNIKVFHEDILSTLEACIDNGFNPLVLNTVSDNYPLDALKGGASGKEFDVLRRTNFYNTISEEMYPIKETEAIYSPKISLFKTAEYKTYPKPRKFAMITMVPVRNPRLISMRLDGKTCDNYENEKNEKAMQSKIDAVFHIAVAYKHDCLIVSDFGCGKEGNPIQKVIEMFNKNIQKRLIHYIFFAVHNDINIKRDEQFLYFHKLIIRTLPKQSQKHKNSVKINLPRPTEVIIEDMEEN
jgi:hypothetical protein